MRRRVVWLMAAALALASCAPTMLGRAKQSAAASFSVYESVTPQVVGEITAIVTRSRAGSIAEADRERLRSLDELKRILDEYAAAHNLFVEAVKTWERTGQEPNNAVLLENQLLRLINRALDLAKELRLAVPAGLR